MRAQTSFLALAARHSCSGLSISGTDLSTNETIYSERWQHVSDSQANIAKTTDVNSTLHDC